MNTKLIRGYDSQGAGHYGATRRNKDGSIRKHNGIDFVCTPGEQIGAIRSGTVSKIGFPYFQTDKKRRHLRYVQITDSSGLKARYFYVEPKVQVGQRISQGQVIGINQDLMSIYSGMTQHYHFEVKKEKKFLNPHHFIEGRI